MTQPQYPLLAGHGAGSAHVVVPPEGSQQRAVLKDVVKDLLCASLDEGDVRWLSEVLAGTDQAGSAAIDDQREQLGQLAVRLIDAYEAGHLLIGLIHYLREIRPIIWAERIWPLVRPHFWYPAPDTSFVGYHRQCAELLQALLEPQAGVVLISGMNGSGKTTLAREVAQLCHRHGAFEAILWVSSRGEQLHFMSEDNPYSWSKWLRELAVTLDWDIYNLTVSSDEMASDASYWHQLKHGRYLLCVDGLDDPTAHSELLDFLQSLDGGACQVLVTTTSRVHPPAKHVVRLDGWNVADTASWLQHAGLHWNLPALIYTSPQRIQSLHEATGGIPLALIWYVAQNLQDHPINDAELLSLKDMPRDAMLARVFGTSYAQLDEPAQQLLLALTLFDWSADPSAWAAAAGLDLSTLSPYIAELLQLSLIEVSAKQERYCLSSLAREFTERQRRLNSDTDHRLEENWLAYYEAFSSQNSHRGPRGHRALAAEWPNVWQATQHVINRWNISYSALRHTSEARQWCLKLITFAYSLSEFCRRYGYWEERMTLCRTAAEAAESLDLVEFLGSLAYDVGWLYCRRHELRAAKSWADWALEALNKREQANGHVFRLLAQIKRDAAGTHLTLGDEHYITIQNLLTEAATQFLEDADDDGLAWVELDLGNLAAGSTDYQTAPDHYNKARTYFEAQDDSEAIAISLVSLGDLALKEEHFRTARDLFHHARQHALAADSVEITAEAERGLAEGRLAERAEIPEDERKPYLEETYNLAQSAYSAFVRLGMPARAGATMMLLKGSTSHPHVRPHQGPLRLLTIIANPADQAQFNVDEWERGIFEALAESIDQGLITIRTVKRATQGEIQAAILQQPPDVIQFIGHAGYVEGRAYLALVDDKTGETWKIDDALAASIFQAAEGSLALLSLATCERATSEETQALLSIAPKIAQRGVWAVVATQYRVESASATIFLKSLYQALAARRPIDWCVQQAHNTISTQRGSNNREFAPPALYMSVKDGDIFGTSSNTPVEFTNASSTPSHDLDDQAGAHEKGSSMLGNPSEGSPPKRTRVFISYSHNDLHWLERLQVHLKPLERAGVVDVWDDTKLRGGDRWRAEIQQAIESAKVAVLLVSADFLASEFIADNELPPLLAAAQADGAVILPLIVSPSRFEQTPGLSEFQAVNHPSKPLSSLSRNQKEAAFHELAQRIEVISRG